MTTLDDFLRAQAADSGDHKRPRLFYPTKGGGKYHEAKPVTGLAHCRAIELDTGAQPIHVAPKQERVHPIVCRRCLNRKADESPFERKAAHGYPDPHVEAGLLHHRDGNEWHHGTQNAIKDFADDGERDHDEDDDRRHYGSGGEHWNTHLGPHFTMHRGVGEAFAKGRYSYATGKPGAIHTVHLGITNPKHFDRESDMDHEALDHAWDHLDREPGSEWDQDHTNRYHDADGDEADACHERGEADHPGHKEAVKADVGLGAKMLSKDSDAHDHAWRFQRHVESQGHDGVTYGNEVEGPIGHTCAVPFNHDQIHPVRVESVPSLRPRSASVHGLSWNEVADRHPGVYGYGEGDHRPADDEGDNDPHGVGWAANHLAHSTPSDPDAQGHGTYDLEFHHKMVPVDQIDHAHHGDGDPRVARAAHGYANGHDVPPLVLVHRHGVYQVADGHHRAEGAKTVGVTHVPAYVHQSKFEDEPFGADDDSDEPRKGPFHMGKQAHVLTDWTPTERVFAPTKETLDPRLFGPDRQMLAPVRQTLLAKMSDFMASNGGRNWPAWARMYLAGSEASLWWGNNDFDILVGIEYDLYRGSNPERSHLRDEEITDHFNAAFRKHWNDENWHPPFDTDSEWHLTGYVNPNSYDIRRIKPYAAYEVISQRWFVEPTSEPTGHRFSESEFYLFEGVAEKIRHILALPEPQRSIRAKHLYDELHRDRSRAFGPNGTGIFDRGNALEKYLDQAGLWAPLQEIRYAKTATTKDDDDPISKAWRSVGAIPGHISIEQEHPERYEPNKGFGVHLKNGETERRTGVSPEGVATEHEVTPKDWHSMSDEEKAGTFGHGGPMTHSDGVMRADVKVPGSERPLSHVYRVMHEDEYQQAKGRGFLKSNESKNLSDEGTCASEGATGAFYFGDGPHRIVRIKHHPEDGWKRDPADSYIKTHKEVPFHKIDRVSPIVHNTRETYGSSGSYRNHFTIEAAKEDEAPEGLQMAPYHNPWGNLEAEPQQGGATRPHPHVEHLDLHPLDRFSEPEPGRFTRETLDPDENPMHRLNRYLTLDQVREIGRQAMEAEGGPCKCCQGKGEHDTGRECYGCDASGQWRGYDGPIPCDGTKPYGVCPMGHQTELDPVDGWQHLDGSVANDCNDPGAFQRMASGRWPWFATASDEEIDAHPAAESIRSSFGEHTSPKGTKYRLVDHGSSRFVSAHVMPSGRAAGTLSWFGGKEESGSNISGKIHKVFVSGPHRRKGLASAMLDHARAMHPEDTIAHSTALSDDGRAWSEKKAVREGSGYWDRSGEEPKWVQPHQELLHDALHSWVGWPTDMRARMREHLDGEPTPSSGSGKIMRAQAAALHTEIHQNGKPNTRRLYRGATGGSGLDSEIPTSWSTNRATAARWAHISDGEIHTLEPGEGHGIKMGDHISSGLNEHEQQWLVVKPKKTQGK